MPPVPSNPGRQEERAEHKSRGLPGCLSAAEARATEAVGRFSHPLSRLLKLQLKTFLRAEAERMRMKASAYKQYGDAAILSLVLEALPQIAAEVGQT